MTKKETARRARGLKSQQMCILSNKSCGDADKRSSWKGSMLTLGRGKKASRGQGYSCQKWTLELERFSFGTGLGSVTWHASPTWLTSKGFEKTSNMLKATGLVSTNE